MEIIKFNSFSNNYNWLSNFYKQNNLIELKIFNVSIFFNSIEPAFQSLKLFHLEENKNELELITLFKFFSTLQNGDAKKEGNKLNINLKSWEDKKLFYMEELIKRKFKNQNLKEKLLNTKEAMLVEYNTGSNYWGVNSKMIGENHLGRIIMSVRNFYNIYL